MRIVAVDSDPQALAETARSLKSAFSGGEIATFSDAMSAYQYCLNHAGEIAVAFLPVLLKPFDGLKLNELLCTLAVPVRVVFTLAQPCGELLSLVRANGSHGYILKPVTPKALTAKARELTAKCWADGEACKNCPLFWCDKRRC